MFLVSLISYTETYFADVIKAIISHYPKKIGGMTFDITQLVEMSKGEIIFLASECYLNKLMYKKPKEYLKEFGEIMSIDTTLFENDWTQFIEAKARRDIGVHNAWERNETYLRKVKEAGCHEFEGSLLPTHEYLSDVMDACDSIVESISQQTKEKYSD
jgi:hypothetical protein